MSFRLIEDTAAFPASIIHGNLVVEGLMDPIYIEELKNLRFEEQYHPFPFIRNVRGVFKNDRFLVIIRGDGTFTVYNVNNTVIVKVGCNPKLSYEISSYKSKYQFTSGLLELPDGYRFGDIMLMLNEKWYVLFNRTNAMFCGIPFNSYYRFYCQSNLNPKEPVFLFNGDNVITKSSLFVGGIDCEKIFPPVIEPLVIKGGYL